MSSDSGARGERRSADTANRRIAISLPIVALALLFGLLVGNLFALATAAFAIVPFPYDVDYGEGIVWQQMIDVMRGAAYRPVGVFPAIVYHYPPLYHVLVGTLSRLLGSDPLATGRTVSVLATLATGVAIAWLVAQVAPQRVNRRVRFVAGAIGGMLFVGGAPTIEWAVTMRVDMLAGLFSLVGLALAIRAIERPRLIFSAALVFNLAIYTKQVSIAGPAAAFLGLMAVRPRLAWALLVYAIGIGLIVLVPLWLATDGRFLTHIISYNVNREDSAQLWLLVQPIAIQTLLIGLAAVGALMMLRSIASTWRDRAAAPWGTGGPLILLIFLLLKTLMLATIMKSGAATNYILEWLSAVAICAGVAIVPAIGSVLEFQRKDGGERLPPLLPTITLLAMCLQAAILPRWPALGWIFPERAAALGQVVAMIRAESRPVISDDMTLILRAGRPVQWEPSIAAELANTGRYDERAFVQLVRQHRFGFFVTSGDKGDRVFDSRYDPAVADAIHIAYPIQRTVGGLILHLPRGGAISPQIG